MVFFLNSCKRHTLKSGLGPGPLEKTDPGPFEKADLIPKFSAWVYKYEGGDFKCDNSFLKLQSKWLK